MSGNLTVWVSDEVKSKIEAILKTNKEGYSDEYLASEKISRFRHVLMRNTMSGLCGELLQLGLMVLENNMKDASGKHKVDMTAYYEELFFNVVVCRNLMERATEGGDLDKSEIHKLVNRMFRGDSEKFE
ncbi:hypothetical protein MNC86_21895 [Pantoea agglomerans]|uniref:hypothetical protein n=1 Tax=Enterobacter agglomerans TaxID=549 RepID=UPI001F4E083F|nr:hypothetical protein [Pantoea agglomerans]MCH9408629.1 hypothetical protein [Pantoea agglomerans]